MSVSGPFHSGEIAVQKIFGKFEEAEYLGSMMVQPVVKRMSYGFIESLSFVVISFVSMIAGDNLAKGSAWSTLLVGRAGFLRVSEDGRTVSIRNAMVSSPAQDPLMANIQSGKLIPMSLIAMDFEQRRRYRINGHVQSKRGNVSNSFSFDLRVEEAFGNCPKYIQARSEVATSAQIKATVPLHASVPPRTALSASDITSIQQADTFFLASYSGSTDDPTGRPPASDVSHRGGQPGFVRVVNDRCIVWPEYVGNNMFMTPGNIYAQPRAGVLVFDFARRRLLQLSGTARFVPVAERSYSSDSLVMDGSTRYIELTLTEAVLESPLAVEFAPSLERSPYNPPLHGFRGLSAVAATAAAGKPAEDSPVELLLRRVTPLSQDVSRFQFDLIRPFAGRFVPGQFASISVRLPEGVAPAAESSVVRSWTLTNVGRHREGRVASIEMTVKRHGLVSSWLHSFNGANEDELSVEWGRLRSSQGLSFALTGIEGTFSVFDTRPGQGKSALALGPSVKTCEGKVLFLSGGIGVTPFLSMLQALGGQARLDAVLVASFRTAEEAAVLAPLLKQRPAGVTVHVVITSSERSTGLTGVTTFTAGKRLTADSLRSSVPDVSSRDVYLCGPDRFMSSLTEALTNQLGVDAEHVHTEDFSF